MLTGSRSRESTAFFAVFYGQCCANKSTGRARDGACTIINNGRMLSSLVLGYSRCQKPIDWRANPDEETTDWRARRGKTAHRVWREGTVKAVLYPYPLAVSCQSLTLSSVNKSNGLCGFVYAFRSWWNPVQQ